MFKLHREHVIVTLACLLLYLQRLCEELEYSELLEKATEYNDPFERMVRPVYLVSCFYGPEHFDI